MKDKMILKVLCCLTFLISGYFTYLAYLNGSTSTEDTVISILIALCMQGGCFIFFVSIRKSRNVTYAILAVGLFLLSIYATADYQAKKEDMDFKKNFNNSEEYNQSNVQKQIAMENRSIAISDKQALQSNMTDIRTDITDTKDKYNKQTDSLINEKNKAKASWRKEQIDKEIRNLNKEMNTIILNKESTLKSKSNEFKGISTNVDLSSYDVDHKVLEKISNNNLGIVSRLNVWFGWDIKLVSLLKQIIFAVMLEFLAVCLHIKASEETTQKSHKPLHATTPPKAKPKPPQEIKPKVTQDEIKIVAKKQIGFTNKTEKEVNLYKSEDAKKYINMMYETSKDGFAKGYKTISRNAQVPAERVGRKVMDYLEQVGVIAKDRRILKNKNEVGI